MTFSINFNGVELSNLVDGFTSIERDTGAGFTTNLQSSNGASQTTRYGQDFLFNTINTKVIVVNYLINGTPADWVNKRNQISAALNVTEPSPLIFEDEPNKVWYAVADGNQPLVEDITTLRATGTITFLVPSGIAESTFEQTLNSSNSGSDNGTITTNPDGSINIQINNQGTLETYPVITMTNTAENGYLGLVNQNGTLELGNKDEADGVTNPVSEILYTSDTDTLFSDLIDATGKVNPQIASVGGACDTNGSISYQSYNYTFVGKTKTMKGLKLKSFSTASGLRGGMKSYTLPADSNGDLGSVNFYAWFRIFAWAGKMGQTGALQILFTDNNDQLVAGYGIVKTDKTGNTGACKFWIGGNTPKEWKSIAFTTNNGEDKKSKTNNVMFNDTTGYADFLKQGASLSFYWNGSRKTVNVPELANVAISKVYVFIGDWSGNKKGTMTHLVLRRLRCRKDKVPVWSDVPNRYQAGSVLEIDMENGKITKDGIQSNNELVNGSEFFSIPKGQTELDIYSSDWADSSPTVEVTWKEHYL